MPRKNIVDLSILVPILVGIIVLMGVYIIVNQQKKVTFADPVVSREVIYQPDYYVDVPMMRSEPIFLQQPTYFNPNHDREKVTNNMYNIQMKEPFSIPNFILPTQDNKEIVSMPAMNIASQPVKMNLSEPSPIDSSSDSSGTV